LSLGVLVGVVGVTAPGVVVTMESLLAVGKEGDAEVGGGDVGGDVG
jgi:hypothetical protein